MRSPKNLRLQREQLDRKLAELRSKNLVSPARGWICAIRESLGMSTAQLAKVLKMPRQNLNRIERSEKAGHVTVATLRKIADALSCDLQITFSPRASLEACVEKRAYEVAKKIVERTHLHMALEGQQTSSSFAQKQIEEIADELIRTSSKKLWEDG